MTTPLKKPVRRRTETTRRDKGKFRRYVVTLYPGDTIGIRLEKCRQEEFISINTVYELAVRMRVEAKRAERRKSRLVKRGKL